MRSSLSARRRSDLGQRLSVRAIAALTTTIGCVSPGLAATESLDATISMPMTRFSASALSLAPGVAASDQAAPPDLSSAPGRKRFGEEGMVTFNIFGDYADDFSSAWLAGGQFGISWFFADNLSLDVQLEQWGISQDGPNAYAIGPALLLRWHFLAYETWSLYADAGCGFFYATNPVPTDGSRFNFTPRVGVGASFAITDTARVLTGVRWLHISNANTSTPNPGRDSLEVYAGLSFGF